MKLTLRQMTNIVLKIGLSAFHPSEFEKVIIVRKPSRTNVGIHNPVKTRIFFEKLKKYKVDWIKTTLIRNDMILMFYTPLPNFPS